jgi:hypothetical protein
MFSDIEFRVRLAARGGVVGADLYDIGHEEKEEPR